MKVQLLSFPGCPHADAAREALRRALAAAALPVNFEEIDVSAADTPEQLRRWGSPTILVDGVDLAGEAPTGLSCRLYANDTQPGVPSDETIRRALRST